MGSGLLSCPAPGGRRGDMMLKYASATILSAEFGGKSLTLRTAHRATFSYIRRPGYLYVRTRAISSRCNDNWDDFGAEDIRGDGIRTGYRTFIGKPAFVNHVNDNHRRARGVIVDAALHEDVNLDGTPDVWVELLHEVDAAKFPMLTEAILNGEITTTSMGCDVEYSVCSFCGNRASTPLEYCAHIPRLKGKRIRRVTASGKSEDVLVREICHGLRFFENSFLVEDPADPTALIVDVDSSHVGPGTPSFDRSDYRIRDSELNANLSQRHLASTRTSSSISDQGDEHLDGSDFVFGQFAGRIPDTSRAPTLGDHVSRVDSIGTQKPMARVVAKSGVARMADNQARRNRADDLGVTPSVRSDTPATFVRQRKTTVPAIEPTSRPRPAGVGASANNDLGEVPLHFGHGEHDTSKKAWSQVLDIDDSQLSKAAAKGLDTSAVAGVPSLQESLETEDDMALRLVAKGSGVEYVSSGSLARTRRIVMEAALSAPVPTEADAIAHAERLIHSGRNNGDDRGSSYARRARSEWLVEHYGYRGICGCMWCGRKLTVDTVTADRFHPGKVGGRYIRENIGPACVSCNSGRAAQSFFEAAKRWRSAQQVVEVAM